MTTSRALETVVERVADLLHLRIGLRRDKTLLGRLRRAIRDEASRHGDDPTAYMARLIVDDAVLQSLMNRVTVQETAFFRHPEQFEALAGEVLPSLPRPVKIWSAGCANGQEAYSLAMLMEEQRVDGSVVATDLSTAALRRTAAGRYSGRELSGLSPDRLSRHFTRLGDAWEVDKAVRDRVSTLHHNLLDPLPLEVRSCEVVFCRNVLIYLSAEQVRAFLDRIADTIESSTILFVGAAETIWQVSDRFKAVHVGGTFIYRQREVGVVSSAQPSASKRPPRRPVLPTDTGQTRPRGPLPSRATPAAARTARERVGEGEPTTAPRHEDEAAARLEKEAQDAIAVGDYEAAVVAFRKCAYLKPHDPLTQVHLGLALEAIGDHRSAKRAFDAARSTLAEAEPDQSPAGLEGYAAAELLRLLDSKL